MTKTEIINATEKIFLQFTDVCNSMDQALLFTNPGEKWSAAANIQHLIISTNMTTLAYRLPKFIVRLVGGKPNRTSRSYDELKEKYYKKLAEGGRASGRFVPKPIQIKYGKEKLMRDWKNSTTAFLLALSKNRTEQDLDNYLAKHPLLGRITLRELCYFTIFHTEHHLQAIHKISETQ
ncbi:MAG: DinB family protein [Ferruginibacter sp.]